MIKELTTPKQETKKREGTEVAKPLRSDQLPIAEHVEKYLAGLPDPEIATIEQGINAQVEPDYVKMERKWHSIIAAVFFSERKAHREHGLGMEVADLVGAKFKETRWGKLMITKIGMDLDNKQLKVLIRPLIASDSKSNDALQSGMRASALYLKGLYDLPAIPEYTVVGAGIGSDDIEGHDPKIKEARRAAIEAGKPPKQIEKK